MSLLLWFRNDIRIHDNPALDYFLEQNKGAETAKAIFFVSEKQWLAHDWSAIKIDFIKRHVNALAEQLLSLNITLEVVHCDDFSAQISFLQQYCQQHNVSEVVANQELEFNEKQRDKSCIEQGIPLRMFESDVIVKKGKVLNKTGEMYKVFTPYKRAWLTYVKQHGFDYLGKPSTRVSKQQSDEVKLTFKAPLSCAGESDAWPLADQVEQQVIPEFYEYKVASYGKKRDFPAIKATSGLSPYLAIGAISPRYLLLLFIQRFPDILVASDSEEFTWLNELIWREFYRNLIFHRQNLSKHQCFNPKYHGVVWPNNNELFTLWCQGKTGYPLVDAAMRQLNQTGWMHNRLRMVVASFLTKHLLIDWRWGEKYFMQQLIDGDLAANNGGWQWAASTGCDAQPYFRVFNPIRQSERFDPKGEFIRKFIPELAQLPDKEIHFPHQYIAKEKLSLYWPAIVDHKEARLAALDFYR
ncbi:deoxyribodipyrimidine photo-lyase [Colwellia sp. PAMC 21821]|uniref:deoxyribodipyrimidine photo-lyase n=1 Tax=Colwellia sp. PAMC 21821 TaxID=1816219 RepID=UPI0009C162EA|nr:deoxyribodipyrimidine photo-lyase [Colwellia sp. PAMC 21821]ARD44645.1 deoxyribodipyrimidine photolyase [Colwellia sp. PAMC 21821]